MNRLVEPAPKDAGFQRYYLLWSNRCTFVQGVTPDVESCRNTTRTKGNSYPGMLGGPLDKQLRTIFSSYDKANTCTEIGAKRAFGESFQQVERQGHERGLLVLEAGVGEGDLRKLARQARLGSAGAEQTVLLDTCIVEREAAAPDVGGILLDYEVFDGRTPAEAVGFFRGLHEITKHHGKALVVNTNPLPRDPNGLNSVSARTVLEIVDGFVPTISSGATRGNPDISLAPQARKTSPITDYKNQLSVLTANGRVSLSAEMKAKLVWNISIFDTSLQEARYFHDEVIREGYRGIMLFRNYTKLGGDCSKESNQVIACLVWGRCSGNFGRDR